MTPYLKDNSELVIPLISDKRYHWWEEGGLSVLEILQELGASQECIERYTPQTLSEHNSQTKKGPGDCDVNAKEVNRKE